MAPEQTASTLTGERALEAALTTMKAARYARLVTDLAERRRWWDEDLRPFFPQGPEGDDFLLIEFRPRRVEIMSFAHKVASEPDRWAPAVLEWEDGRWVLRERAGRG